MITLVMIIAGISLYAVCISLEWIRQQASVKDGPWIPQPDCKFKPHPRWRVIRKA